MRDLALDLARAGDPGKGLSRKLRRNLTAATRPIKTDAQANARAIPAHGRNHTGLRDALARATRISIAASRRTTSVRLIVDGKRMPAGQQSLPPIVEGLGRRGRWRHPVFGDRSTWVQQDTHPFVTPAVHKHLPEVQASVLSALAEIDAELRRSSS